ncbi:kynurenine 3-monooxygenase isoform X1 [Panulirus ornatus]|uniref:kynurenine 3-monooxygenase isoform X1 n=2 Tax=Panulirus ornatus TaxID=150431 RepID=UPI003A88DDC3
MIDQNRNQGRKVIVIGAGLVGTLEAGCLARRGYEVHLYEYRGDIRKMDHVPGRSINLAMSIRGLAGLRLVGLEDKILREHGIPMRARMIHNTDGTTRAIPYNKDGKSIYSVGRRFVNEELLTRAESFPNVHFHFNHKLISANLDKGTATFLNTITQEEVHEEAELLIGCDGAYSNLRKQMMKRSQFDYSQQYIPHGYLELCIPATTNGEFAMPPNYLHIWPRGKFMMIALPNQDRTWTVSLFMPFEIYDEINTPELLLEFFKANYPDAIDMIGRERLIRDFFANKPFAMITVKCSPYHVGSTSLLMGDAAHAIVPFYGQGMNCGMEDCVVLNEIMDQYNDDLTQVLPAYSKHRNPDAEAIADLAMYNYIEMRDLVNSKLFLMRKKVDDFLCFWFPNTWIPLYTMVTFSRERYHLCISKKKWQDEILRKLLKVGGIAGIGMGMLFAKTEAAHALSCALIARLTNFTSKTLALTVR